MVAKVAMTMVHPFAHIALLVAATPFWTLPTPPAIKKIPVEDRCALVSKIIAFRVQIHPNIFRMSAREDEPTHRLAYWRGKPLVCASVRERNHRDALPIFSRNETCKGDFALDSAEVAAAPDRPDGCVIVEIEPGKANVFRFVATITVHKASPPDQSPGYGVGVGAAPIEGTAKRKGDDWELKQLFKPKASDL